MKLAVVTPAFYPNESHYRYLKDSCARRGLPLYAFGQGQPWCWDLLAHFTHAPAAIRALPAEYDTVMFTDACDSFVMADEEEILEKFRVYGEPVLLSAEHGLYPWGLEEKWAASVDVRKPSAPPWQHPNGGGWIGERNALLGLLDWIRESGEGAEAQSRWIDAVCKGMVRLDDGCRIFQTMSGPTGSNVEWRGGRLYNRVTDSFPCVVHFNGKLGGIEEFWGQAYGG